MAFGFGATVVPAQERLGKKAIVSPSIQEISAQFFSHFCGLKDPRVERTKDHKLIDIIAHRRRRISDTVGESNLNVFQDEV
jgi:hypothetical protein